MSKHRRRRMRRTREVRAHERTVIALRGEEPLWHHNEIDISGVSAVGPIRLPKDLVVTMLEFKRLYGSKIKKA